MQLLLLLPNFQQLSNMRKNHLMLRSKARKVIDPAEVGTSDDRICVFHIHIP